MIQGSTYELKMPRLSHINFQSFSPDIKVKIFGEPFGEIVLNGQSESQSIGILPQKAKMVISFKDKVIEEKEIDLLEKSLDVAVPVIVQFHDETGKELQLFSHSKIQHSEMDVQLPVYNSNDMMNIKLIGLKPTGNVHRILVDENRFPALKKYLELMNIMRSKKLSQSTFPIGATATAGLAGLTAYLFIRGNQKKTEAYEITDPNKKEEHDILMDSYSQHRTLGFVSLGLSILSSYVPISNVVNQRSSDAKYKKSKIDYESILSEKIIIDISKK